MLGDLEACNFNFPIKRKLLVIDHPRCGSGFASAVCNDSGMKVGHEQMKDDGISSCMFAVDSWKYPFGLKHASNNKYVKFDKVVQHICNPFHAIPEFN